MQLVCGDCRKFLEFSGVPALFRVSELRAQNCDWTSFCQLVGELITGSVRRNVFTRWEMDLLLDLQMIRIRKSSRPDMLRRYLKALQQQLGAGEPIPLRLSRFHDYETKHRAAGYLVNDPLALPYAS